VCGVCGVCGVWCVSEVCGVVWGGVGWCVVLCSLCVVVGGWCGVWCGVVC
jgi:hypothetical protein